MFARFRITRELFAVCDVVNVNRKFAIDLVHYSVMDLGVKLVKQGASAADAMVFVVTLAASKSQIADVTELSNAGISVATQLQAELALRNISEVAVAWLQARGGDSKMIVAPEEIEGLVIV